MEREGERERCMLAGWRCYQLECDDGALYKPCISWFVIGGSSDWALIL